MCNTRINYFILIRRHDPVINKQCQRGPPQAQALALAFPLALAPIPT